MKHRHKRTTPIEERFWRFVPNTPEDECWQWLGAVDETGYGRINRGRQGQGVARAHRVSWVIHRGPIPPGKLVVHKCDTPSCTNPRHLRLGNYAIALREAQKRGVELGKFEHENPQTKLSDQQVNAIRGLAQRGVRQIDLARQFGVADSTISNIVSGRRRWAA